MNQTTKRVARKVLEKQIRTRVSDAVEHKLEDSAVRKVKQTVTAKAAVVTTKVANVAEKADAKLETARKIKHAVAKAAAVCALFAAVFHRLNRLYSYIPRLKNANDKVASLTGVDIASKIIPNNK